MEGDLNLVDDSRKYLNLQKLSIKQKNDVYDVTITNDIKTEVVNSARKIVYEKSGYKLLDAKTTPTNLSRKPNAIRAETKQVQGNTPTNQPIGSATIEKSRNIVQILDKINLPFDKIAPNKGLPPNTKLKVTQKFRALKSYIFNDSVNFRKKEADFKIKLANLQFKLKKQQKE